MALTVLYTVTRSEDFKSISIADNGTAWGIGGEMATGDVTGIVLSIFGTDKTTALKTVTFTAGEISTFVGGGSVVLYFTDSRLWGTTYAPDNFYTCQLDVSGGSTVSTQVVFDSYFYVKKIMMEHVASVILPLSTYYEANRQITGDLAALTTLEYLSSVLSVARENKWRKMYDELAWNYNL